MFGTEAEIEAFQEFKQMVDKAGRLFAEADIYYRDGENENGNAKYNEAKSIITKAMDHDIREAYTIYSEYILKFGGGCPDVQEFLRKAKEMKDPRATFLLDSLGCQGAG